MMQAANPMATHDIVLIGASAGGVEAISAIVAGLPRDLPAAVLVVLHVSRGRSVLPEILTRAGRLPATHPNDGEQIQYGRIYVAPPDHHMTIEGDVVRITHGPSENGVRPALDPLFRSAARAFGSRVVAVVATGSLDDGTAGMAAVKEAGGIAIVQDPDEAFAPSMPRSVMASTAVDHVLPVGEIGRMVVALVREEAAPETPRAGPHVLPMESDRGPQQLALGGPDRPGDVSVFTCPECSGTLWESEQSNILRFRCRVGHVYTQESMLAAQVDSVDRALWTAVRALEERAALSRKLAERARARQHRWVANAFEQRAIATEDQAALVKRVLVDRSEAHILPDQNVHGPVETFQVKTAGSQSD
jgi:two-component system chemotaxis response regulator CheB